MIKTLDFGVVHFTVAFTATYLLSGSLAIGGAIAPVEPAVDAAA